MFTSLIAWKLLMIHQLPEALSQNQVAQRRRRVAGGQTGNPKRCGVWVGQPPLPVANGVGLSK